jgi:hypothetical protein
VESNLKNTEQMEYNKMIDDRMLQILDQNTFEDMQACMLNQINELQNLAHNQYPQRFMFSGNDKQRMLESVDYFKRIIKEYNLKQEDLNLNVNPQITDVKYMKGISFILNGYYNPNPVIELLTKIKKGELYKNAPKVLDKVQYSYEVNGEGVPMRTFLNEALAEKSQGYYIRLKEEEIFLLFDAMDHKIKTAYRAFYEKGVVIRYEELTCYYNQEGSIELNQLEAYDVTYEDGKVDKFTLYRYDGSEYIYFEKYAVDSTQRSGLRHILEE